MLNILIPTIRPEPEVQLQVQEILKVTKDVRVIVQSSVNSAAVNRNKALEQATSDIIVMLDDDMTGFYTGWLDDLTKPFEDPNTTLVSSRLLTPDLQYGYMTGDCTNTKDDYVEIRSKQAPTACIAFRKNSIRFDENYIGSGFEDNDYCLQLAEAYPDGKVYMSNKCKLIHINEMKNQKGRYWQHNFNHFHSKWSIRGNGIIALYKTFSGNEFVNQSIKSIYPYVDKIIMVHSDISWSGEEGNNVYPQAIKFNDPEQKLVHLCGSWTKQFDQYNVGLQYIAENFDPKWVQIIDTDEVWDKANADIFFYNLKYKTELEQFATVKTSMYTYIKSASYQINPPEPCKPVAAINWKLRNNLWGPRFNQSLPSALMENISFHHYSFVRRTWDDIKQKIITSHIGDSEGGTQVNHVDIDKWKTEKWDLLPNATCFHPTVGAEHYWQGIKEVQPLGGCDGIDI